MGTRLRAHESAALASSIFIVCRVRAAETEGYFADVREDFHFWLDSALPLRALAEIP